MRLRTISAVGVLPEGPGRPVRRDDRRRSVLSDPEPALRKHGIGPRSDEAFQIGAAIKAGVASGLRVYVGDKGPRLFEIHARADGILLEIQGKQNVFIIADNRQKVFRLGDAVVARPEMVGAPEQPGLRGFASIVVVSRVYIELALGGLLHDPDHAAARERSEVDLAIPMRDVHNRVQIIKHCGPLIYLNRKASLAAPALQRKRGEGITAAGLP